MVVFEPPSTEVGTTQFAKNRADWAIQRIASPKRQGNTLYRRAGTWYLQQYPSQDVLDAADRVYLGGHIYDVSTADYADIPEQYKPQRGDAYPSDATFPASTLFPGV